MLMLTVFISARLFSHPDIWETDSVKVDFGNIVLHALRTEHYDCPVQAFGVVNSANIDQGQPVFNWMYINTYATV